jgi:hypothetical protein
VAGQLTSGRAPLDASPGTLPGLGAAVTRVDLTAGTDLATGSSSFRTGRGPSRRQAGRRHSAASSGRRPRGLRTCRHQARRSRPPLAPQPLAVTPAYHPPTCRVVGDSRNVNSIAAIPAREAAMWSHRDAPYDLLDAKSAEPSPTFVPGWSMTSVLREGCDTQSSGYARETVFGAAVVRCCGEGGLIRQAPRHRCVAADGRARRVATSSRCWRGA